MRLQAELCTKYRGDSAQEPLSWLSSAQSDRIPQTQSTTNNKIASFKFFANTVFYEALPNTATQYTLFTISYSEGVGSNSVM